MIDLDFKINGKKGGTPRNAAEIKLISNWSETNLEDNSENEVSTNTLQFVLEDATEINNHVAGGMQGQGGIFEGLPYEINYKNLLNGSTGKLLDGYIDLTDNALFISCDEVEAVVKKNQNLDWLTERADGVSFAYLANQGFITNSDFVEIPVVLNYRPDSFNLLLISTSLFTLFREIYQVYKDIVKDIGTIQNYDYIEGAFALLADLAYLALIVVAIYNLIKELFDELLPAIRRYKGMTLLKMFEVACDYLQLSFQSTIFAEQKWKEVIYMPTKSKAGKTGGGTYPLFSQTGLTESGYPNANSAVYNIGDFFRTMKQMFNAAIKIEGKTLRFERRDYWDNKSVWVLPNVETDQSRRLSTFRYNTNEISANYLISFQTDVMDENTLENFKGTNFQAITEPSLVTPTNKITIKGLDEVRLPFALGQRKNKKTAVEIALLPVALGFDAFLTAANSMANIFQSISLTNIALRAIFNVPKKTFFYTSFTTDLLARTNGQLLLSQDLTGVDKLLTTQWQKVYDPVTQAVINVYNNLNYVFNALGVAISGAATGGVTVQQNITQEAALSLTSLSARDLWSHYHCINSFVPNTVDFRKSWQSDTWISTNNQAKIYEGVEIPFCEEDWLNLQSNNTFTTSDGRKGEVFRIEWDIQNDKAIIDYIVKEIYTANLQIVYNEGE